MTIQELSSLAKNKKIKLEDLEIEDILKFNQLGFLNPTLCDYFNLTEKEVKKIRKQKGLTNSELEDFVRNAIVTYYYIKTNYPTFRVERFKMLVHGMASSSIQFQKHREFYLKEVDKIDWVTMDPFEEIISRKIDIEYREERFLNRLYPHIDNLCSFYIEEDSLEPINSNLKPKEYKRIPKKEKVSKITSCVPRNKKVSEEALKKANYLCEIDSTHPTFIKRSDYHRYMEPHHLIPLEFQDQFEYSLDVEPNIVSLCSLCHDEIHYGIRYKKLIKKLYDERIEDLTKCGIYISLEDLYQMYDKEFIEV